mmetsp:Transcript_694/g.1700  ORF Transcript_694/g.1700 Transcript_694/m.1700 type:complete len:416 (-) Transcript_694:798-2045(-)
MLCQQGSPLGRLVNGWQPSSVSAASRHRRHKEGLEEAEVAQVGDHPAVLHAVLAQRAARGLVAGDAPLEAVPVVHQLLRLRPPHFGIHQGSGFVVVARARPLLGARRGGQERRGRGRQARGRLQRGLQHGAHGAVDRCALHNKVIELLKRGGLLHGVGDAQVLRRQRQQLRVALRHVRLRRPGRHRDLLHLKQLAAAGAVPVAPLRGCVREGPRRRLRLAALAGRRAKADVATHRLGRHAKVAPLQHMGALHVGAVVGGAVLDALKLLLQALRPPVRSVVVLEERDGVEVAQARGELGRRRGELARAVGAPGGLACVGGRGGVDVEAFKVHALEDAARLASLDVGDELREAARGGLVGQRVHEVVGVQEGAAGHAKDAGGAVVRKVEEDTVAGPAGDHLAVANAVHALGVSCQDL